MDSGRASITFSLRIIRECNCHTCGISGIDQSRSIHNCVSITMLLPLNGHPSVRTCLCTTVKRFDETST